MVIDVIHEPGVAKFRSLEFVLTHSARLSNTGCFKILFELVRNFGICKSSGWKLASKDHGGEGCFDVSKLFVRHDLLESGIHLRYQLLRSKGECFGHEILDYLILVLF